MAEKTTNEELAALLAQLAQVSARSQETAGAADAAQQGAQAGLEKLFEERKKKAKKKSKKVKLFSTIGRVAGTAIGGPIGGQIGATAGRQAAGADENIGESFKTELPKTATSTLSSAVSAKAASGPKAATGADAEVGDFASSEAAEQIEALGPIDVVSSEDKLKSFISDNVKQQVAKLQTQSTDRSAFRTNPRADVLSGAAPDAAIEKPQSTIRGQLADVLGRQQFRDTRETFQNDGLTGVLSQLSEQVGPDLLEQLRTLAEPGPAFEAEIPRGLSQESIVRQREEEAENKRFELQDLLSRERLQQGEKQLQLGQERIDVARAGQKSVTTRGNATLKLQEEEAQRKRDADAIVEEQRPIKEARETARLEQIAISAKSTEELKQGRITEQERVAATPQLTQQQEFDRKAAFFDRTTGAIRKADSGNTVLLNINKMLFPTDPFGARELTRSDFSAVRTYLEFNKDLFSESDFELINQQVEDRFASVGTSDEPNTNVGGKTKVSKKDLSFSGIPGLTQR